MTVHSVPMQTARSTSSMPVYAATDLTLGGNQTQITLNDQVYTLRITRAGKLILTK